MVLAGRGDEGGEGHGGDDDGPEHPSRVHAHTEQKKKPRERIDLTGMGSRYANTEEVTDAAIAVQAVLALASLVSVGYLVWTAPSRDSPQFARDRDGDALENVKLGIVEEEEDVAPGPLRSAPRGLV